MSVWDIVGGVLLILICAGISLVVLFQESPKGGGIGALTGADSYYNKNQGRTFESILSKCTKYLAIAFFVIAITVYAVDIYLK